MSDPTLAPVATDYHYELLDEFTGPLFARLADPAYRALYQNLGHDPTVFALGASYQSEPMGAVLAEIFPDTPPTILDVQVASAFRGAGVGSELLARMEKAVRARQRHDIRLYYVADSPFVAVLEKMLARRGWPAPEVAEYLFEMEGTHFAGPWAQHRAFPPGYSVFAWDQLTDDDRWMIEERQRLLNWVPWAVWPLDGHPDPAVSIGLRYQGEVIGWVTADRVERNKLEYQTFFVSPEYPAGRAVTLLAEAIHRQFAAGVGQARWIIRATNTGMLKFFDRRLTPYVNVTRRAERRRAIKALR